MNENEVLKQKLKDGLLTYKGICKHMNMKYRAVKSRVDNNTWRLNELPALKKIL